MERPRLHQNGRTLATEVAVNPDDASPIRHQELEASPSSPGDGECRRVEPPRSCGPASDPISGWSSKAGAATCPTLRSQNRRPLGASPRQSPPIIARMAPFLVESDLLSLREPVGVGPVIVQIIDSHQ